MGLFDPVSNYSQLLARLWLLTIVAALVILGLGYYTETGMKEAFDSAISFNVQGAVVPGLLFFTAVGVATLFRMLRLHEKIAGFLGVQRRFNMRHIIAPMAAQVGIELDKRKWDALQANRERVMQGVLYTHLKDVDAHEVSMVQENWSWFYCCVNTAALAWLALPFYVGLQWWHALAWTGGAFVAALGLCVATHAMLSTPTRREVQQIIADEGRKAKIREILVECTTES